MFGPQPAAYIEQVGARCCSPRFIWSFTMNRDQVAGRLDQAAGKVKEVTGHLVKDNTLEAKGKAEQIAGKVKANFGDAKEIIKDSAKDIVDKL